MIAKNGKSGQGRNPDHRLRRLAETHARLERAPGLMMGFRGRQLRRSATDCRRAGLPLVGTLCGGILHVRRAA
jgi:hypothetical protein